MRFSQNSELLFTRGEPDDPRLGERVQMPTSGEFGKTDWDFTIIGFADDRGVLQNRGRPGAAEGPNAIRKWLYRLVAPKNSIKIADLGDLQMSDDLNFDHEEATHAIAFALTHSNKVIVLGGGHDWGFSPISALMKAGETGFINIDAHLDVRPSQIHHSGTPYWRAIEAGVRGENALWVGIQKGSTASLHNDYAIGHGGKVFFADEENEDILQIANEINNRVDNLDISLDLDAISMSEAPGVSAPQPIGIPSKTILSWMRKLKTLSKNRTFGIYELSPENDLNEMTSRLAARFVWEYIS